MKKIYDTIFVTNLPSFYKLNLFNSLNRKKKILAVFTGDTAEMRNDDFFKGEYNFDYFYLRQRTGFQRAIEAYKVVKSYEYNELILGGWDSLVMVLLVICFPKYNKSLIVESSHWESTTNGFKAIIKKRFLKRISKVYVPGKSNEILLKKLKFNGEIVCTGGVGIFNIIDQPSYIEKSQVVNFLYVGRLSEEKNLSALIDVFNSLPELKLNIVGSGPLNTFLKSKARINIYFHGAVENKRLPVIYQACDVFILPSISEPWGLVVEEALNNGLPVIVSNRVGCAEQIVNKQNGIIFSLKEKEGLNKSVLKMTDLEFYNKLRKNISLYNFDEIAKKQINSYL